MLAVSPARSCAVSSTSAPPGPSDVARGGRDRLLEAPEDRQVRLPVAISGSSGSLSRARTAGSRRRGRTGPSRRPAGRPGGARRRGPCARGSPRPARARPRRRRCRDPGARMLVGDRERDRPRSRCRRRRPAARRGPAISARQRSTTISVSGLGMSARRSTVSVSRRKPHSPSDVLERLAALRGAQPAPRARRGRRFPRSRRAPTARRRATCATRISASVRGSGTPAASRRASTAATATRGFKRARPTRAPAAAPRPRAPR